MSPELNLLALCLLITLFVFWNLDFIATILTLKNLEPKLPEEFRGIWDDEKYAKAQDYERAQARFGIISSISNLTIFLAFWLMGGFGWIDSIARGYGYAPIPTGLIFMSIIYLASWIVSLPFDIYSTFVLEEKFGFNKTTTGTFIGDQIKGLVPYRSLRSPDHRSHSLDLSLGQPRLGLGLDFGHRHFSRLNLSGSFVDPPSL